MGTHEEIFTKQYDNKEVPITDIFNSVPTEHQNITSKIQLEPILNNYIKRDVHNYYPDINPYLSHHPRNSDEPIDLTQNRRIIKCENTEEEFQVQRRPRVRRNRILPMLDESQLQSLFTDAIDLQGTETKQAEILKAAKSLFSKRTRTLYHWMYPNTPKAQIKLAVANSWENLGAQEKQFYISQVLVRFGFPQSNLMVNPQLGGIKQLPPFPQSYNSGESSHSAKELEAAISSISGGEASFSGVESFKRKQGRPPGSKNKKKKLVNENSLMMSYKLTKDFQDDPELSKELEKFATSFDWLK